MTCHACIAIMWLGKDIQPTELFDDHKDVMERTGLGHRYNYVP